MGVLGYLAPFGSDLRVGGHSFASMRQSILVARFCGFQPETTL